MQIDDKMVHLTRNALLVAGLEMGKEGDHWPVIKANIHALMRDYEELKIEQAVQDQLKEHIGQLIGEYETVLENCDAELRAKAEPHVRKLRELHDAMFAPVNPAADMTETATEEEEAEGYKHWQSSAAIIEGLLEEKNGK